MQFCVKISESTRKIFTLIKQYEDLQMVFAYSLYLYMISIQIEYFNILQSLVYNIPSKIVRFLYHTMKEATRQSSKRFSLSLTCLSV